MVYRRKLRELARVIHEVAPDVLALQEVGGEDALIDLQRALGAGLYDHRALGTPDARGIACAVLSRVRFEKKPRVITAYPAATVRTAATELLQQGHSVAVLGDLNDGPTAATTQLLHGPGGSALTSRGFHQPDDGDPQRLWNVSELIPSALRYSRVHHGAGEMLDQILVSEALLERTADGKRRAPLRVEARVEGLRSIGDDPRREVLEVMPDHAAVSAVFEV